MRLPVSLLRLFLSLGIVASGLGPRMALCLGSDGHREIESLDASCCRGETGSAGMSEGCARTCTDVPLALAVGIRAPERGGLGTDSPTTVVLTDMSSPPALAWRCMRLSATAGPSLHLAAHLGSTVLLC